MSREITFGQFYPAKSIIHRMDPRAKILLMIVFIIGVFMAETFWTYLFVGFFAIVMIASSRVPIRIVLKSLKTVLFLIIVTSIINVFSNREGEALWAINNTIIVTVDGMVFALKMSARLILLVLGTALLTLTTTPINLTDGLESLMKPLKIFKLPVHDIAVITATALRFIPTLMEEIDKIMMAQKARGADFDTGNIIKRAKAMVPILIPLFVSAFRRADELALALDARCYNATPNRTKFKVLKFGRSDLVATIAMSLFIFFTYAINIGFGGLF